MTIKEVIQATKLAEAHTYILEMKNGYESLISEREQKLSGGQ